MFKEIKRNYLKSVRRRKTLTQKQVAEKLAVETGIHFHPSTVSKWETGREEMPDVYYKVLMALEEEDTRRNQNPHTITTEDREFISFFVIVSTNLDDGQVYSKNDIMDILRKCRTAQRREETLYLK